MKKSVLKQSIIALVVGAAISGGAVAADDALANATNLLKEAIKSELQAKADATKAEQDNKIQKTQEAIKKLAKFLSEDGNEDAPTLSYQLKQLSDELDNKADVTRVNEIVDAINEISELTYEHEDKFNELKSILSKLGDADAELAGRVNTLTTDVEGLVSSNDEQGQDISDLKDTVWGEDGTGETNGLVKNVEDNTNAIAELKNTQSFQDLEYVKNSIKDVRTKTKDAIEGMAKHLDDDVLPVIEENRKDIDANTAAIDTNTDNLEALRNSTAEALDNLGNNVAELNTTTNELVDGVNANSEDIKELSKEIKDNVLPAIEANKTELATKADKTELAAKADKTELATKADKTELAIKADKDNVYSKSDADQLFALKADSSVVGAQAVDINKLRMDVDAHTKHLDHLDNRVNKLDKDLKRGLAAQAALTGLFQPYTVGKANFTAAVGGYKSQTAVAVGTGYRYNQNIATKAGVAFTQGGGVTYNAGVNFEW